MRFYASVVIVISVAGRSRRVLGLGAAALGVQAAARPHHATLRISDEAGIGPLLSRADCFDGFAPA